MLKWLHPGMLGVAVVLAVRLMQTDQLQSPLAFWRTRPTSSGQLRLAKLVLAALWLSVLPVMVEYGLLQQWNYGQWVLPCVLQWALELGAVLLPALAVAVLIPAASVAVPVAFLLALVSYQHLPGAVTKLDPQAQWNACLSPDFYVFYIRGVVLLLVVLTPFRRSASGMALVLVMVIPIPWSGPLPLPDFLNPTAIRKIQVAGPVTVEATSVSRGSFAGFAKDSSGRRLWIGTAAGQGIFHSADEGMPQRFQSKNLIPGMGAPGFQLGMVGLKGEPDFLSGFPEWSIAPALPSGLDGPAGRGSVQRPLRIGSFTNRRSVELPLREGAMWQEGPWRLEIVAIRRTGEGKNHQLGFLLKQSGPSFKLGSWLPAWHVTGLATERCYLLVNRKLQKVIRVRDVPEMIVGGSTSLVGREATPPDRDQSAPSLHRDIVSRWVGVNRSDLLRAECNNPDISSVLAADSELMREASLILVEWEMVQHHQATVEFPQWPAPIVPRQVAPPEDFPRRSYEDYLKEPDPPAGPDLSFPSDLTDLGSVRAFIDSCLLHRPRGFAEVMGVTLRRRAAMLKPLGELGPTHFKLVTHRLIALPNQYGYGGARATESSDLIDSFAEAYATPQQAPLLLHYLEQGMPLERTLTAHGWFREMAIPRLAELCRQFSFDAGFARALLELRDPRVHKALLAWCRTCDSSVPLDLLSKLATAPHFPSAEALAILRTRRWEMAHHDQLYLGVACFMAGSPDSIREVARMMNSPIGIANKSTVGSGLEMLLEFCEDAPLEPMAMLAWLTVHEAEFRWNGRKWTLPPSASGEVKQ